MPTSPTGIVPVSEINGRYPVSRFRLTPWLAAPHGFTLLEVLAVLMVIGIAMGSVVAFISQDGAQAQMDKAVERFVVISDHISELAILAGEPMGLMLEPPEWRDNPLEEGWRYSWKKMTAQGWQDVPNVPAVELPTTYQLVVLIDEIEWEYEDAPEERLPLVAFYPSGEVTPFEIEFSSSDLPGEVETVIVDVWGKVVWKERAELEAQQKELNP